MGKAKGNAKAKADGAPPDAPPPQADPVYAEILNLARRFAARAVDDGVAQDIAQALVVDLWEQWTRGAGTRDQMTSLKRFVFTAVRYRIVDYWRAAKRQDEYAFTYAHDRQSARPKWMSPHAALSAKELEQKVAETIAAWPQQRREVWLAVREDGMTYAAVAAERGIMERSVESHITRANQSLRQATAQFWYDGFGPEEAAEPVKKTRVPSYEALEDE